VITDFVSVTEMAGDDITREQVQRICNRYYWAGQFCKGMDAVEVACGSGPGLGYLNNISKSFEAGDYSKKILETVRRHYQERILIRQFDAQNMPYENQSKDIIIIFEALYYLPDPEKFVSECKRVLRKGGRILVANANKDLFDFNPSPYSHKYHGVVELNFLFNQFGFKSEFWGDTPVDSVSIKQKILRPVKKMIVISGLMPKTTAGKKLFKKIVFGKLVPMPQEITAETCPIIKPSPLKPTQADTIHKVIFCAAVLE
jgi:ubiquinone/menaquinone biosynthesis C-methylase UbiE